MAAPTDLTGSTPTGGLSKSQLKKIQRKQLRSHHMLLKHEGIHVSVTSTRNLLVANGGLGNGVQREELQQLFSVHGIVTRISMPPRKPYAFVCYQEMKDAEAAVAHLSGKVLTRPSEMSGENITLYLSYVKEVPKENLQSDESLPPGLVLIEDFIDAEMEDRLLTNIDWDETTTSEAGDAAPKTLKHRRVKHYGYEFRYDNNNVDKDKPLPDGIPEVFGKVIDDIRALGNVHHRPNQITVNQYQPGQGIPPHIDTHSAFEGEIISLSLGSKVVMDFKRPNGQHIPVLVPQRSLLVMTGESRYLWTHGITPRKHDVIPADTDTGLTLTKRVMRTSFTFRAIRHTPCDCDFPSQCDSQQREMKEKERLIPKSDDQASALETEHVHKVYETIARHFSDTRHSPWPRVTEFINQLPNGSMFVDIGCGNGKYLGINTSIFEIGCDRSSNLVEICKQRDYEAFTCDALSVPIRDNSCDAVISIAVIHHLSTQERRKKAVSEIVRILGHGGQALIYVWAMEQERYRIKSKYLKERKYQVSGDLGENLHHRKLTGISHGEGPSVAMATCDCGGITKTSEGFDEGLCKATQSSAATSDVVPKLPLNMTDQHCIASGSHDLQDDNQEKANPVNNDEQTNRTTGAEPIQDNVSHSPDRLSVHVNRTAFVKQDLLVPWHLKSKNVKRNDSCEENVSSERHRFTENVCTDEKTVFHRFYHVFKEGELESLCQECSGVQIIRGYYDEGNWCVILQKD